MLVGWRRRCELAPHGRMRARSAPLPPPLAQSKRLQSEKPRGGLTKATDLCGRAVSARVRRWLSVRLLVL